MKIAVLMGGLRFDSQRNIINGILEEAVADGAECYIFTCDAWTFSSSYFNQGETAIFSLPDFAEYDGVIIHGDTVYDKSVMDKVISKIKQSKVPCVSLNVKYSGMLYIGMENENGIYEIVKHMIEVHHVKQFGFISGPKENRDAAGRMSAFKHALRDYNIKVDEDYIYYGDYHPESGKDAVKYFYDMQGTFPGAIVAANDEMAVGAYDELKRLGYDVPGQVLLSGYDYAYVGRNHSPKITSVKRPEAEVGRQAYRKLRNFINGVADDIEMELKSIPVFSESCGCTNTDAEDELEFRKRAVETTLHAITFSEILKSSSADFTGVATFESLLIQIRKYVTMINPQEFYLCMCSKKGMLGGDGASEISQEENLEDIVKYSSEIYIPIAYRNGEFSQSGKFPVKKVLPDEYIGNRNGRFYTVIPVHYQNRCFGYCVLGNSKLMIDSEMFHLFIMNINNALENIRKQNMLNAMVQKLNRMWVYDTLTGVYNRAGFFKYAYGIIEEAREKGQNLFVLFLDLDGLKSVNDKYGHDEGDLFIKSMGKIMTQIHSNGELLMRYGGDEFVVLGRDFSQEDADEYVAKVRAGIDNYNVISSKPYRLDASMGYTLMDPSEEFDLEELIETADREMYKDKNAKKRR